MLRSGETLITSELPQVDTGFEARGGQLEVEANRGSRHHRQLKGVDYPQQYPHLRLSVWAIWTLRLLPQSHQLSAQSWLSAPDPAPAPDTHQ